MARAPTGTVTFLFTDIEGSTAAWDRLPEVMQTALRVHDELLRSTIARHHGHVFSSGGDGFAAAFARADQAVGAAVESQVALGQASWPDGIPVRVRMGIHTGETDERGGNYFGPAVNRAARVMAAGHGGQILVSGTTAGILIGVELQYLGDHRLRDLSGVERLFQVRAQGLESDFPRLRTADATAGNLPIQVTSFLGREREVTELSALLGGQRLVTLVGVGGVGKTRLAVEVAADPRVRYRDGAWLCELADVATGDAVVEALATTLGARQQRGMSLLASVVHAFRDAQALVVVDNCEHVLVSAGEVVAALLRDCAGVTVLATSREPLGAFGEVLYPVEPLVVPEPADLPIASPACTLFIERARERGVVVGDEPTRAAVVDICRRLDGLPLAIELAAARARTLAIIEMNTRLDERFRLLGSAHPIGPRRQQTLWNVVDWSYQLLEPADQELFSTLAVFFGGFTIEAAAAVSGRPVADVEMVVWGLTERSLVQLAPGPTESRYQMLETLRQYGLERLIQSATDQHARDAHMRYFVDFARQAGSELRGPDEARNVWRITSDLANLRAAHQHAVATKRPVDCANLVVALHDYAEWRQFFELGTWAQSALELAPETTGPAPSLHAIAGWSRCIADDFDTARDHARQGLAAEAAGGVECGWLHDVLAHCAYYQGDVLTGLVHSDREIARARISGDLYRLSYVLADSGTHAALHGDTELGLERANEALRLAERINNPDVMSMAHIAKGFVSRNADPAQSIEWFRRGAALGDTVDSSWTSRMCRLELSLLLALHGDPHDAVELGLTQLLGFRRVGDTSRVRATIRMMIPALHQVVPPAVWADLAAMNSGTADRPYVRDPFCDQAVADVISKIVNHLGRDAVDQAASRGTAMSDQAVLDLALDIMQAATHRRPRRDLNLRPAD